jgi:hypothetical protein
VIINQDENLVVPDKTIAVFPILPDGNLEPFDMNYSSFLKPLNVSHNRDWFTPHFYKCLPLVIGNMQGFVFSIPYSFSVLWNGGNLPEDISIKTYKDSDNYIGKNTVAVNSEFGNGIITIHFPVVLKTPPGINLMTIAPPNFPVPGMSPLSGVVESDNIRFTFTFNIKIDIADATINVGSNTPLCGLLPIPRYFCDSFELKSAYDIFDKEVIEEEMNVSELHGKNRERHNNLNLGADRIYYSGKDILGNKFKDHQLPKKIKK